MHLSCTFSITLTTRTLYPSRLWWFGTCSCKPIPEGLPPSSIPLMRHTSITAPGPDSRPAAASTLLSVKDGEHISGLSISLRTGAARLHGKIAWATDSTTPAQSLRVHLVPLDPAQADNPLR